MRFVYLDDIPTPYRLGVFRKFREQFDGDFRVLFCAASEPGRTWNLDWSELDCDILSGWQWRPGRQVNPFSFKLNPGVSKQLTALRPNAVALTGYVHPTMWLAGWWCRTNRVPYGIACESSFLQSRSSGPKWLIKRTLFGHLVRNMAFGLPVGHKAKEYLKSLGAARQPMYFFPNTPDVRPVVLAAKRCEEPKAASEVRVHLGLDPTRRILLFVGRLIGAKRPMDLLRAFQSLEEDLKQQCQLVFVGDGELAEELKKKAVADTSVRFVGWLQDSTLIYSLMAISDLMVLPSGHEPWGAVVNECMAAGTPVIATDAVGAAHELIEDGITGFRYPVGDVETLARLLTEMVGEKGRLKTMGGAAVQKAQDQGHEFAAANLLEAVTSAVREARDKKEMKRRRGI